MRASSRWALAAIVLAALGVRLWPARGPPHRWRAVAAPVLLPAASPARDERAGLLAAALVAVAFPHAFPTSHTAPATLGDLLAIASLLLFVKVRRDSRARPLVVLVGLRVVGAPHLS